MNGEVRPILLEQLEPRILLSGDSLLNIAPNPLQDTFLDNTHQVAQYAELLDTQGQVEEQINLELAPSDTSNSDVYRPIFTLFVDDDNTKDESVDADLSVDNIGPTKVNDEITILSNDSVGDIESKVDTTEDDGPQVYVNDPEISIEENTSIEIRGPPATETVALSGMHLVDPAVDYFDGQIVYLDFDGEENLTYNGPVTIEGIDVPAFVAPGNLAGQEDAIIAGVVEELNQIFAGSGVAFTVEKSEPHMPYSTIYIGGDDSAFAKYGSFLRLAEQVDVGNQDSTDNALVFCENIVSGQLEIETLVADSAVFDMTQATTVDPLVVTPVGLDGTDEAIYLTDILLAPNWLYLAEATNITISFPNWFYAVFSIALITLIFLAGAQWKNIREICKEFPKIRRALDIISTLLLSHNWTEGPLYVSAHSPVSLTQEGKKMLKDSNFEDFYIINKKSFFDYITAQKPKSKSEVETAARSLMLYLDQAKTPNIELVESFSYKNGELIQKIRNRSQFLTD